MHEREIESAGALETGIVAQLLGLGPHANLSHPNDVAPCHSTTQPFTFSELCSPNPLSSTDSPVARHSAAAHSTQTLLEMLSESLQISSREERGGALKKLRGLVAELESKECPIRKMTAELIHKLWPAERVVLGLRVSRDLRLALLDAPQVVCKTRFKNHWEASRSAVRMLEDLRRIDHRQCGLRLIISKGWKASIGCSELQENILGSVCVPGKNLVHLELNGAGEQRTAFTCEAFYEKLALTTSLRHLSLPHNDLNEQSLLCLASAMSRQTELTHLNLSHNSLGNHRDDSGCLGASVLGLAEVLEIHSRLEVLKISHNVLETDGVGLIASALRKCCSLQHLDMSHNRMWDEGLYLLQQALMRCDKLISLNLASNGITDQGVSHLAALFVVCTQLHCLDLCNNRIGDQGACELLGAACHLPLEQLLLDSNQVRAVAPANMEAGLRQCTTLVYLGLSNNQMGPDAVFRLLTTAGQSSQLAHLNLANTHIGIYGGGIQLEGAEGRLAEGLAVLSRLCTLFLEKNFLGADGVRELALSLHRCQALQTLVLDSNEIGEAAEALGKGLLYCSKLEVLDLANNNINSQGMTALAASLNELPCLRCLNLGQNMMLDMGLKQIAAALRGHPCLKLLNLRHNMICDLGNLAYLSCPNLTKLDLRENKIGDKGMAPICSILQNCSSLSHVILGNNTISDQGASTLAGVLQSFPSLSSLVLDINPIGNLGACRFAEALQKCTTLTYLNLSHCSIDAEGQRKLEDSQAWMRNCSNWTLDAGLRMQITKIDLYGNSVSNFDYASQHISGSMWIERLRQTQHSFLAYRGRAVERTEAMRERQTIRRQQVSWSTLHTQE